MEEVVEEEEATGVDVVEAPAGQEGPCGGRVTAGRTPVSRCCLSACSAARLCYRYELFNWLMRKPALHRTQQITRSSGGHPQRASSRQPGVLPPKKQRLPHAWRDLQHLSWRLCRSASLAARCGLRPRGSAWLVAGGNCAPLCALTLPSQKLWWSAQARLASQPPTLPQSRAPRWVPPAAAAAASAATAPPPAVAALRACLPAARRPEHVFPAPLLAGASGGEGERGGHEDSDQRRRSLQRSTRGGGPAARLCH